MSGLTAPTPAPQTLRDPDDEDDEMQDESEEAQELQKYGVQVEDAGMRAALLNFLRDKQAQAT
jgi:hypothetical protein